MDPRPAPRPECACTARFPGSWGCGTVRAELLQAGSVPASSGAFLQPRFDAQLITEHVLGHGIVFCDTWGSVSRSLSLSRPYTPHQAHRHRPQALPTRGPPESAMPASDPTLRPPLGPTRRCRHPRPHVGAQNGSGHAAGAHRHRLMNKSVFQSKASRRRFCSQKLMPRT